MSPGYDRGVSAAYLSLAPVLEHPRLTEGITSRERPGSESKLDKEVFCPRIRGDTFTITTNYLYVNLPIMLALALTLPAVSWGARLRIATAGMAILAMTHFLHLFCSLRAAYAAAPFLDPSQRPLAITGFMSRAGVSVLQSDVALLLPFVLAALLGLLFKGGAGQART